MCTKKRLSQTQMIGAHVIAEKRYGVTHLLHLMDSRIGYKVKSGSLSNCPILTLLE